jgi:ABC-2 type transport system permease protein
VGLLLAVPAALLGTAAFVALGLLLAGTLRSEAVLAVANLVWVVLAAGGAVVVPATAGSTYAGVARALPSGALGDALRAALHDGRLDAVALAVLLAWAAGAALLAVRFFRWD